MTVIQATTSAQISGQFGVSAWMKRHPVAAFYLMAYGFPWLIWIPFLTLSQNGLGLLPFRSPALPLIILGPFVGPTLSALIMTALGEGKPGVSRLLRRYIQWRAGVQWYLLVLLLYPAAYFATSLWLGAAPLSSLLQQWPQVFTFYLPLLVVQVLLGGGLGEEPGWRGFALPRLQSRFGPVVASLIVGLLWALWHLPLFVVPEASQGSLNLVFFLLTGMALATIMTWVYNNTGGSLLLMMVLHESEDTTAGLSQKLLPGFANHSLANVVAYGVLAVLVILFTWGRLSYRPSRTTPPADASPMRAR